MVASCFSLISAPSFLPTCLPAPGCSRHVEACWKRDSASSSNNHALPWSTSSLVRGRPCHVRRGSSSRTTTNTGRGTTAAAMASLVGKKAKEREVVVPEPDYRIPIILLGFTGWLVYQDNLLPAAPVGLLGLLLLFQTTRVRFVFDEEALEVKIGDQLQESGENVFVGGKNRWKYSTFVNWELWWPNFPILVYFKEKQTKPEGQVHFFPVIFNGKQLYDVMVERAGPSKTSGPKQT